MAAPSLAARSPSIARIEPTEAQLRAAWARAHRPTWPATYEDAMADAVLGRLVRMGALHPGAPDDCPRPAAPPAAPPPAPWAPRAHHPSELPPGYVDIKRRASGERDDD